MADEATSARFGDRQAPPAVFENTQQVRREGHKFTLFGHSTACSPLRTAPNVISLTSQEYITLERYMSPLSIAAGLAPAAELARLQRREVDTSVDAPRHARVI